MDGHIRTNQKCPKCRGKFEIYEKGFICRICLTHPDRYFIDLYYKGRLKIYSDESGQVLDSWKRADRELAHIRWQIDNKQFDPDKFKKKKDRVYQFENYAKSWIEEQEIRLKVNEIAVGTLYKYKMYLRRFIIPYFGIADIRTITTREMKNFNLHLAQLKVKGGKLISAKYRQTIIGLVRNIFYDGLNSGDLNRSQVPVFPTVEVMQEYFDYLEEDEQDEILAKIPQYDFPIFHVILTYGIRPSEVRALKRDCVISDFDKIVIRRTFSRNNNLRESPKENKWRIISLLAEAKRILKGLPVSITGFVFVNKWGRRYSQSYINDTWNKACKDAGYRYIPLKNASRHSLGTKLAMEGYGEDIIAKVLGHSDTKTTKHYTRYASESLKDFYKRRNVKRTKVRRLSSAK